MSEYHQSCVPAQDRERAATLQAALMRRAATSTSGSMPSSLAAVIHGDAITQDRVWTRVIRTEKKAVKDWEANWKYMTDYDWKGDLREDDTGNTIDFTDVQVRSDAMNYGRHVDTDHGRTIQRLQRRFDSNHRKKKLSNELGTQ